MRAVTPSCSEERWLCLAQRFGARRQREFFAQRTGDWQSAGPLSRLALAIVGLIAAAALLGILFVIFKHGSAQLLLGAALTIGAAELLIVQRRLYNSGIEEALETAGMLMVVFWLIDQFHLANSAIGALVYALGFALVGLRLRNSLLSTCAALALIAALAIGIGRSTQGVWPTLLCYPLAAIALLAGAHRYQRPSSDRMLDWAVVILPVLGWYWFTADAPFFPDARHIFVGNLPSAADGLLQNWLLPATLLVYGGACLMLGLQRRTHAPVIASLLCAGCLALELHRRTHLSAEAGLIIGGCVLLFAAIALERWLKTPRNGISSNPIGTGNGPFGWLQQAGAAALTPMSPPDVPPPPVQGGGGSFAGGGAESSY